MAIYKEDFVEIDLAQGRIFRSFMNHAIGSGDDLADRFGVRVFRDGEPVDLGGNCAGYFVRNTTGETVVISDGVVYGNEAYVTLPEACYAVEGSFSLAIKVTSGNETVTLRIIDGVVDRTNTSEIVDPGDVLPSIEDLLDTIEAAVASIPADYSSLWTTIAPVFSTTASYQEGQYVTYNGGLYMFTSPHTGSWNASHVISMTVGSGLNHETDAIYANGNGINMLNLLANGSKQTIERSGLTIEFEKGVYHIHGTMGSSEAAKFYNVSMDAIKLITPGMYWFGLYQIKANTSANITLAEYYKTSSSGSWQSGYAVKNNEGCKWNILNGITDVLIRFEFAAGVEYDHYVVPVLSRSHTDILSDIVAEDYKPLVSNNQLFNPEDDILLPYKKEKTFYSTNGIKFNPRDGIFYISGTATANAFYNILASSNAIPAGITAGESYLAIIHNNDTESSKVLLDCWYYDANGAAVQFKENSRSFVFNVPEDATGVIVRLIVKNGTTFTKEEGVAFGLYPLGRASNEGVMIYGGDIHKIRHSGFYFGNRPGTYENCPVNDAFMLVNYEINGNIQYQLIYDWTGADIYVAKRFNTTWSAWQHISAGGEIINNYNYNSYNNSYTITCSPTITTDTNNFLASTGDTTDRTGEIQAMLNTTGFCQLGPGKFYVTGVEIPNNGMLRGCGNSTKLVLASSVTDGYAVKLKTYGCVKDMLIAGLEEDSNTTPSSIGTRHGILFEDSADSRTGNTGDYFRSAVENCMIRNFTGGGITMYNTGYNVANDLIISDCFIFRCGVGLNISYFSEFHRITNVTCQYCLYGCIDNGGNNNFACCDFSGNYTGLLIDNSSGQSRNNSHGSFVGCTIHHSFGSDGTPNAGTAIRILGAESGEVFTGLQVSNGAVVIDDSYGIRFIGANIGDRLPITITDSVVVTFSECSFLNSTGSVLTQSGNTRLEFRNCYLNNGTEYNPMG